MVQVAHIVLQVWPLADEVLIGLKVDLHLTKNTCAQQDMHDLSEAWTRVDYFHADMDANEKGHEVLGSHAPHRPHRSG